MVQKNEKIWSKQNHALERTVSLHLQQTKLSIILRIHHQHIPQKVKLKKRLQSLHKTTLRRRITLIHQQTCHQQLNTQITKMIAQLVRTDPFFKQQNSPVKSG